MMVLGVIVCCGVLLFGLHVSGGVECCRLMLRVDLYVAVRCLRVLCPFVDVCSCV